MVGFAEGPVRIAAWQRVGPNLVHHRGGHNFKISGIGIETEPTSNLPDLLDGFLEFLYFFVFHKNCPQITPVIYGKLRPEFLLPASQRTVSALDKLLLC